MAYVFRSKDRKGKFHAKYRFQYRDKDGTKRTGTGTTSKSETKAIAEKVEAEHGAIKHGLKEAPKEFSRHLYSDVAQEYLEWGAAQGGRNGRPWGLGHVKNRKAHLPFWGRSLKLKKLSDLKGSLVKVEKVLRKLMASGRAGKTVSNYLESLNSFCNYCVNREYLEKNPLEKIKSIDSSPQVIRRALSTEEIKRLLSVVDKDHYHLLYRVALFTGLRANELRQLTVDDCKSQKISILAISHLILQNLYIE